MFPILSRRIRPVQSARGVRRGGRPRGRRDAGTVRSALKAIGLRMDGKPAAATTTRCKRMVFNNALRYALEKKRLTSNPLLFVDWTTPEVDDEIDAPTPPTIGERGGKRARRRRYSRQASVRDSRPR